MRFVSVFLCLSLALNGSAQTIVPRGRPASPAARMAPPLPALQAIPALSSPLALQPALSPLAAPAAPTPAALAPSLQAAREIAAALPDTSLSDAPGAAEKSFSLLTGDAPALRGGSSVLAAPAAPERPFLPELTLRPSPNESTPETVKNVRRMMLGTAVMKTGMETVTLSVPMLALTAFGGFSAVAGLVVVYGLAQAAFAGMSSGLAQKFSARKVLAGAVLIQAALVTGLVALGAANALSMGTMIPFYLMIGGVSGVIETTRHSIPALLLGQDERALKEYNAKLHIWYQVAGVGGALAAGALIGLFGPLWSLVIQPPAYALAAWRFWGVRIPAPSASRGWVMNFVSRKVSGYLGDIKAGAKLILGDARLRWVALAYVLPQIAHRVLENLLIPVFAKSVLENPAASAWILTASNAGELAGAAVLLRLASRFPGAKSWVKWGALGLLLVWGFAFSSNLPILLALTLASSLTWAASDLTLRSEVQRSIPDSDQPRALGFLYGAFVVGSALVSLGLGLVLDSLPVLGAIAWICGGFTVLALAVLFASRRFKS